MPLDIQPLDNQPKPLDLQPIESKKLDIQPIEEKQEKKFSWSDLGSAAKEDLVNIGKSISGLVTGMRDIPAGSPEAKDYSTNIAMIIAGGGAPATKLAKVETEGSKVVDEASKSVAASQSFLSTAKHEINMAVAPMAEGSPEAMAAAKSFANRERAASWQLGHFDEKLQKFPKADQEKMWKAMDEESTAATQGRQLLPGQGLSSLTTEQLQIVKTIDEYRKQVLQQAVEAGLFQGEGLKYYTPRMLVEIGEDGTFDRVAGSVADKQTPAGTNLRTSTSNLMHRKYVESSETEAAAKASLGEGVQIAKNIRTLPLAVARLEKAVAGRNLVNEIKALSKQTGQELVSDGDKEGFFTLDHPALKTYTPRFIKNAEGKFVPAVDQNGDMIFDKKPIYISKEFEGPLKAVLTSKPGEIYKAMMQVKSTSTGLIMYSPLVHNMVEYSRAIPLMPGKVTFLKAYFDGNKFKHSIPDMQRAISNGMAPIGKYGNIQDVTDIMNEARIEEGAGPIAKLAGKITGKFISEDASKALMSGMDKAGNFWHNTLLWDRIGDLQAGIYKNIEDDATKEFIKKGIPEAEARKAAGTVAAHLANRFAGTLPHEAMSEGARRVTNILLFSRTFTLGNFGVMKDMFVGLPVETRALLEKEVGELATKYANNATKRAAIGAFVTDVAMTLVAASLMQDGFAKMRGEKDLSQIERGYVERYNKLLSAAKEDPIVALDPLEWAQRISSTYENEPGKQNRILAWYGDDGTAFYLRNPLGKIGDDFIGWAQNPVQMIKNKMGTIPRPILQTITNDEYLGAFDKPKKVYDPDDHMFKIAGDLAWNFLVNQVPTSSVQATMNLASGDDATKKEAMAQIAGAITGFSSSHGFPGGPAVGEYVKAKGTHEKDVDKILPDVRKLLKDGKQDEAVKLMMQHRMTKQEIRQQLYYNAQRGHGLNQREKFKEDLWNDKTGTQ